MEPRDQRIVLPYIIGKQFFDFNRDKQELDEWIG